MSNKVDIHVTQELHYSKKGWQIKQVRRKPEKKWLNFFSIYGEMQASERCMLDTRKQFVERKSGRPRKSQLPKVPKAVRDFIEAEKREELSSISVFEFYLQCSQYHKGAAKLLEWCKQHLRKKSLSDSQIKIISNSKDMHDFWKNTFHDEFFQGKWFETWVYCLGKEHERELAEILNDPIFIRKDRIGNELHVWSGQLFEDPFSYILKNVWVWNAAMDYCLEMVKKMELMEPRALIAFRAVIDRLDTGKERRKNSSELVSFLVSERDRGKDKDSKDTIERLIRRVKLLIPYKNKKFNW